MNKGVLNQKKGKLFNILLSRSFSYNSEKVFKLSSGRYSNYYINSKTTTLDPEGMNLIGNIIFEMIAPIGADAIGGLTLGADPIAYAVSLISFQRSRSVIPFIVRKTAKVHGTKNSIEGNISPSQKVVIVDDVITTGASTLEAIDKAREKKLEVVKVIALIDREEGGKIRIEKKGIKVSSLFTKTDFFNAVKIDDKS